jgi:uncharacterized protein
MTRKINTATVFGATGYTGRCIIDELLSREVSVTGVARDSGKFSGLRDENLDLVTGSLADAEFRGHVTAGQDAVVLAIPPRFDDSQEAAELVPQLLAEAETNNYRLGIVGGAGTLQIQPDGPRLMDQESFPAAARPTAESHARLLDALNASESSAEWFYLSPPAQYGARFPGARTGSYRLGTDGLVTAESGGSTISAEDYASAFVDELFGGRHLRSRFSVGY